MPNDKTEVAVQEIPLEIRLSNLEKRGEDNYHTLKIMIKEIADREAKLADKIKAVDVNHFLAMEARHDVLSDRLQLLIEKVTVATECCYHLRHQKKLADSVRGRKLAAVMWAFDLPDDWWEEGLKRVLGEGLSTVEWVERCFKTYRNYELVEVTNEEETDLPEQKRTRQRLF